MTCSLISVCQHFEETYYLHFQEKGNMFLCDADNHLAVYTVL